MDATHGRSSCPAARRGAARAADPDADVILDGQLLARMNEAPTGREHWKILITSGLGFFTDAGSATTTTFVYPAEIFPVQARTTSHGIAAAAGKIGGFIGTYALAALLPAVGLGPTSVLVAGVSLLGLLVTLWLLPEPKGSSLEDLTEGGFPAGATALGLAESRGTRPPAA